jgi:hypothetical protein
MARNQGGSAIGSAIRRVHCQNVLPNNCAVFYPNRTGEFKITSLKLLTWTDPTGYQTICPARASVYAPRSHTSAPLTATRSIPVACRT